MMLRHELLTLIEEVPGWLTIGEAALLADTATQALPYGTVVEIGSYLGRSTVVLGAVARQQNRVIIAIDPHQGDLGPPSPPLPVTWERFLHNLHVAGVQSHVLAIRQRSVDVELSDPISMLFIDGAHDYDSCRADFEHFRDLLTRNAHVLFHDYGDPEPSWGVNQFVHELTAGEWVSRTVVDGLIALTRA